jgi:carboxyl-terminal processing protease
MKRLLFPLISALTLSTSVQAGISDELHKKCLEARDYAGCVNTNKKFSRKKDKEISGIGIRLFLNSDTAELTIQSVINDSPAASADIQPNDVIIKIDGKSTKGMGITEAVSLIKGPIDKPIKLTLLRVNEAGKKEKINIRLVRDTFKVPNKKYIYERDMSRKLEFFFPENLKEIFPENELYPNQKKGTSI